MKSGEEIMKMLEAFDLTGSLRDAAELARCSHHTVAKHVAARDAGGLTDQPAARPMLIDEFLPKLEEWMEHSRGKIRADVAHDKLLALGYQGSERTTRRAVATVRAAFQAGRILGLRNSGTAVSGENDLALEARSFVVGLFGSTVVIHAGEVPLR